ncbi:MAG TPA: alpha/beta fold hydrolase [Anaeromyxobacter sp.]|nr:alpha/beta fold hydrolase [Anaeromyxobacter sp.]
MSEDERRPVSPVESGGGRLDHGGELDLAGGPDAVLLLHGFTGSTFEVHPLAARLAAEGMRVLAPVMAGHGGAPGALREVRWAEWVEKAAGDLHRLNGARRTFLAGLSMGALVACALARERAGAVDGLVLLAPALRLTWPGRLAAWLGRLPLARQVILPKGSSDVGDPEMRRRNTCLEAIPLRTVSELAALAAHVDRLLPEVRTPALVLGGAHDGTVTAAGVRRMARRLPRAELRFLDRSRHLLPIDVERDLCAEQVLRFLASLPGREAAPGVGPHPASSPTGR